MYPAILSMSRLATGRTAFNFASGLMVRPSFSLYFLMYTRVFFVTSVRGMTFPPQISAKAGESVFGAKIPTAFITFLPAAFFSALIFAFVAFVMVVFVVVV